MDGGPTGKRGTLRSVRADLMTGVTYMIPFVTIAGVFQAVGYTLGGSTAIGGDIGTLPWYSVTVGSIALNAMVPILGGFVAYAVADRPGLAPGFALTALVQDPRLLQQTGELVGVNTGDAQAGYLGALIVGLLVGVVTQRAKSWDAPPEIRPLLSVLVVPVGVTAVLAPVVLTLGVPLALTMNYVEFLLRGASLPVLLVVGATLGAMMAADLGGPVNKVAYVFAVGLLPELLFRPMAAVMVAGMVPPLGMAASHLLAPSRYPDVDGNQSRAAAIAGLSFITEGALAYTTQGPGRSSPACVLGSAVGGAASMGLGVTMPAPHGGILVVPLANDPLAFLGCIALGAATTAATATVRRPKIDTPPTPQGE
ncbi:PTS fructose transporter subunit IIC [Halorussus gelatinilyticus]|uniref:PTS fructose transporter subunit IIC n=1 Tax=Halorussus gelatinilyticus TaxID=2937524 RepID=A0A8U0IJA9_9EURY|nr:PTS fructose transporter subunit IIC [Halorussus gelatinilyticus]UPW01197.1 PTS fructose transporter subunit IIC [Halorussus gelatinilyticus]